MTIFRLLHVPNASVSGAFDSLPSDFILRNAGDSFSDSRIQTDTASSTIDTPNGMRQPQSANTVSPSVLRVIRMTTSDSRRPTVAVVWIQLVYAPRLPCGA